MAKRKCKVCHKPHSDHRKVCPGCIVVQELYRKERRKQEGRSMWRGIGRGM